MHSHLDLNAFALGSQRIRTCISVHSHFLSASAPVSQCILSAEQREPRIAVAFERGSDSKHERRLLDDIRRLPSAEIDIPDPIRCLVGLTSLSCHSSCGYNRPFLQQLWAEAFRS